MSPLSLALSCLLAAAPVHAYEDVITTEEMEGALENNKLGEVFSQYLATLQMYEPERATRLGLHGADHALTQRTPERVAKELEAVKRLRAKLGEIQKKSMSPALKIDLETLKRMLEADIHELEDPGPPARRPQSYLEPLFLVYQMMSKDYEEYATRSANAILRLKQFPAVLEQAERNLSHPPEAWTRHAIKQANDALTYISDLVPLFRGYTRYDPALKARLDETMEDVKTALAHYAAFLESDVLPASDGDPRAGKDAYAFYLERLHALDVTPGAALSYSKKTFKKSLARLESEARNIDGILASEKGWKGVLEKLPKEHPPADDILKVFRDEMDRAFQYFDEHKVVEFPRTRLQIKRTPGFMAAVLPYVHYAPSFALDDVRVSELFVMLPPDSAPEASREKALSAGFNYAQAELLTAYAIMPGMHLRAFEASSNRSKIRRISRQPVVANGWASYSELLAEETGYYSSYWSRFLRCYVQALRAARAYADAALHTKKWTQEEASVFFQEKLFLTKTQADAEVLRLSLSPTEAFSYVIGMDRILELRRYYQRTEGKSFDLRRFHSRFLRLGEIPMDRIEAEMLRQELEEKK
ncbi:MAG TPA: hypothetical protein DCS63_08430 [Elusimicrobia bacterium]|nr:hypothetical protein [Elusimicrobiota bacterium]